MYEWMKHIKEDICARVEGDFDGLVLQNTPNEREK